MTDERHTPLAAKPATRLRATLRRLSPARWAWLWQILLTALLLFVFVHAMKGLFAVGQMPQAYYDAPWPLFQALRRSPRRLLVFGLCFVPLLAPIVVPSLRWSWHRTRSVQVIRLIVCAAGLTMTWAYATMPYNFYFDRWFVGDRVLIVVLWLLSLRVPWVMPLLTLAVIAIASQLQHPLGGFSWTDKALPIRVMVLASAWVFVWMVAPRRLLAIRAFFVMLCAIAVAQYFIPGWEKIQIRWWEHGHIYNLIGATYVNGWLAFLSEDQVLSLSRVARAIDVPLVVGTLILEVGALLLLTHRRVAYALIVGWIGLHLGIFICSGICFWKWIIVDAALFAGIMMLGSRDVRWLFSVKALAACCLLAVTANHWCQPPRLAWYDTPLAHSYVFRGIGESGRAYVIGKHQLAPYDLSLAQNRLHFLGGQALLTGTFGATMSRDVARELMPPMDDASLRALIDAGGPTEADARRTRSLEVLLQRYLSYINRTRLREDLAGIAGQPHHIWTFSNAQSYDGSEPLERIEVWIVTDFIDIDNGIRRIDERKLLTVEPAAERD